MYLLRIAYQYWVKNELVSDNHSEREAIQNSLFNKKTFQLNICSDINCFYRYLISVGFQF